MFVCGCINRQFEGHSADPGFPHTPTVVMVTYNGDVGGVVLQYRWRCDDYDDNGGGGGGGVSCHSLSLGLVLSYRAHHPVLLTSVTYPGGRQHVSGEKSTQQELEGPGQLYVCSREQGCVWPISLSFKTHFRNSRQVIFFHLKQQMYNQHCFSQSAFKWFNNS